MIKLLINGFSGIVVGVLSAYISILNVDSCHEDCPDYIFFRVFGFFLISLFIYLLLSMNRLQGKVFLLKFFSFFIVVVTAILINRNDILKKNFHLEKRANIATNFDYMYMSILTKKDVTAYSNIKTNRQPVKLKQWERCAIDGAFCDEKDRTAHMRCKSGEVYVKEQDWNKFELIPEENIQGAEPLRSMKLCQKE